MPRLEAVELMTAGGRLIWGVDDPESSAWTG